MPSKPLVMYPAEKKLLVDFGERLKLARLRRRFSADTVAQRSGISRMTLYRAERGSPAVSLGVYLRILVVLRLEDDLAALALDDRLGRRLQDLEITTPKRVRKPRYNQAP
jgi:transcriptional regulator with XRE-family HTH domain